MSTTEITSADALGGDELIARAAGLFELLRANTRRAEAEGRLPEENIDAIRDAGLFRIWNPRRYGGHEADFRTHVDVNAELARACRPPAGSRAS